MRFGWLTLGITATASLLALADCGDESCSDTGTCAGPGSIPEGGPDSGNIADSAPTADAPPSCDPNADPKDSLPCVDDSFAVFVDALGSDTNDGTKASPIKSITAAIARSGDGPVRRPRIYICGAGPFVEHVKLAAGASPDLFGGFACGTWAPSSDKPKVLPSDAGYALEIDGVTTPLRIEDLAFEAQPGTAAATSSICAFVNGSPSVTMKRVSLTAGDGANGADGTEGAKGAPVAGDLKGSSASGNTGGAAKVCTCLAGGTTTGGRGGDVTGAGNAINGETGAPPISPSSPATNTGVGQSQNDCNAAKNPAQQGSDAPNATPALSPALGALTLSGWQPGDGADGPSGIPAQGGGGGGSRTNTANAGGGGGGGCGGCGGQGGTGGKGGGGSIALAAFASPVTVIASTLAAGNGGHGGAGKLGGDGQSGSGVGTPFGDACSGNVGGKGGNGGASAGGSGGVSAAILYKNAPPTTQDCTLSHKTAGDPGIGGVPGTNNGAPGQAGDSLAAP